MKVISMTNVNPNMSATRTYEDFSKFIGVKPTRFGILARMFLGNTATYLTEALGNIFYKDYKKTKFLSINTMMYEWQIEQIINLVISVCLLYSFKINLFNCWELLLNNLQGQSAAKTC